MSTALLKKLGIMTALLVLAWGFYLYRQVPRAQAPFAKLADQADRLVLEKGTQKVELKKQENAWTVAAGTGTVFAADQDLVKALLSTIKGVQVEDEISRRADRASEYEVNPESGTRVSLWGAAGTKPAEGLFGKQAPNGTHIYFRYPDQPNVYLARGLIRGEIDRMEANAWRNRQLISIPEMKIEAITIEMKGSKTEYAKASTETWTMNGKFTEPGPVDALVGRLSHLRADDFVDPAAYPQLTYEGLTHARIHIKASDAAAELRIGTQDPTSKRYPVSAGKEVGLAWLSEAAVQSILKK